MKKIILAISVLFLVGCASADRYSFVKLTDRIDTATDSTMMFDIFADAVYPESSATAENIRINWIKNTIQDNNLNPNSVEIVSRKPIKQSSGWINDIYIIKYTVKAKK